MIDFSRFFYLTDPLATRPLRVVPVDGYSSGSDWRALATGKTVPSQTLQLRGYSGAAPADFIWTGAVPLLCVSERVTAILREHDVKGWGTYDVAIADRKKQPVPGYCGFSVISFAGNLDFSSSQIVTMPSVISIGKAMEYYIGFAFDPTQWDGSDIFRVGGFMIATDKVKNIFKRNHITNVRLIPILDVQLVAPLVEIIKKNRFE
jgi:hypothetical protein